jgi:hypothetical protein
VSQEKALLLLFSLGHVDLVCLVSFLLTALTGLVALLTVIGADILAAHSALAVTSHVMLATTFALAATAAICRAVAEARTGAITRLQASHPLFLSEE